MALDPQPAGQISYLPSREGFEVGSSALEAAAWADDGSMSLNNFDFLRFALASLVILSHSFALIRGTDATEPLMRVTGGQLTFGRLAVDWFFVISGFLITNSWVRGRGLGDFLRKRFCRIYPGFIVAILFGVLVVAPLANSRPIGSLNTQEILPLTKGLLNLHGYEPTQVFPHNPKTALNGSIWTISFEAWCYVGIALLGILGLLRKRAMVLGMFLTSIFVAVLFLELRLNPGGKILGRIFSSPRQWASLLPYFLAGTVFYLFRNQIPYSNRLAAVSSIALLIGAAMYHALTPVLPLAGTYLLFWFAYNRSFRLEHWVSRGDLSYGIYLYAFPIQQTIIHTMRTTQPMVLLALSWPASIVVSFLSWNLVEKWFLRRKRERSAVGKLAA